MITVRANARNATYISDDLITSGSVGIPVTFVLSEDFDGLSCIAVFEGSGTAIDVALMGDSCVVPHEVVATAGGYLRIGIYASNSDGTMVIPTVWAGSKMILPGTEPSEVDPSEPTPSWVAQVQAAAAEALENSEEAIEIAGGAQAAADDARESASAAAVSATAAAQSESAASGYATSASGSASAAAQSATGAAGSASNAASSASAAAGSATAAAGSAEAAAASEAAAREVEESIPADYTDLSNDVSDLKSQMGDLSTLKTTAKSNIVVAINELYDALFPPVTVTSISAVFTQGQNVITTNDTLDSLKSMLVVTATYSDSTTATVASADYTLSGTLTVGTSTITVAYSGKTDTFTVNVVDGQNVVDIAVFAGQSNMDGRGDAAEAPVVASGTAFKWDSSNNAVVDFTAENSLIPAFVKTYYEGTGVPIVEVKEAIGGTGIAQYISDYLQIGLTQLQNCHAWLGQNGKTVRRVFMLWNQGESDVDGDGNTGTTAYENYFSELRTAALAAGIERIFIINIGQASNGTFDFAPIRTALQNVCNDTNTFMVCDKFFNATQYMNNRWHYNQVVYNAVGANSAQSVATYYATGTIPTLIDFDASDVYGVPEVYGTLDDWNYTLVYTKVSLDSYKGNGGAVRVYHLYKLGDKYYEARLARNPGGTSTAGAFYQNQNITNLVIDDGVKYISGTNDSDAVQSATWVFREMAECVSIVGVPDSLGKDNAFRNSGKLKTIIPMSSVSKGNLQHAFTGTAIEEVGNFVDVTGFEYTFQNCTELRTVGNISGTYKNMQNTFSNCSKLEGVGTLDSTAITSMNIAFNKCSKLAGIVKIMSPNVTSMMNTFYGCDLTKIEIQVPANSTTYTTVTTAYPDANVTTF